jgi:predicted MFS family arabinose efflux permease
MLCWAMALGCEQFFNICTVSLRQTIVPNQLLGRVSTVNAVVAWSAIPLGSLAGGTVIKATGNVMLVYLGVGAVICSMAVVASFTALRHTERYLPKQHEEPQPEAGSQAAFSKCTE